ncbi:MAG: Lsr2 family protein [Propionibacteriaceae bacterium]|jgi:hypothetical protein|nr:Lsr2 family protein [Propionibacteriaceae bacterium]
MAKHTQVVLIDDVDGSIAEVTVAFAIDGVSYEIDLSEANAADLRSDFAKWIGRGRRVGGRRRAGSRSAVGSGDDIAAIRAWAKANGYQVNDRGRISAKIREAYAAR